MDCSKLRFCLAAKYAASHSTSERSFERLRPPHRLGGVHKWSCSAHHTTSHSPTCWSYYSLNHLVGTLLLRRSPLLALPPPILLLTDVRHAV